MPAKEKQIPRLYKGHRNLHVPMDSLFKTVKSIIDSGKESDFLDAHGALTMAASPALVNAVKTHLFEVGAHEFDEHAARIVGTYPMPRGSASSCFD